MNLCDIVQLLVCGYPLRSTACIHINTIFNDCVLLIEWLLPISVPFRDTVSAPITSLNSQFKEDDKTIDSLFVGTNDLASGQTKCQRGV